MDLKRVSVSSLSKKSEIEKILASNGFEIVDENPDFAVSYGGDGSILYTQRRYSVPVLAIKKSRICHEYEILLDDFVKSLEKIREGKFEIQKELKIEAKTNEKILVGLNEIQLHNPLPTSAVRFSVQVDGRFMDNLIGDGAIVATPFGSSAYYQSTGGKPFKKGIGISFNNLYEKKIESFVVPEDSKIILKIIRGPGLVLTDNNENFIEVFNNDEIMIKKSKEAAQFIKIL